MSSTKILFEKKKSFFRYRIPPQSCSLVGSNPVIFDLSREKQSMKTDIAFVSLALLLDGSFMDAFNARKQLSLSSPAGVYDPFSQQPLFAHESEFEDIYQEDPSQTRKTRLAREKRNSERFATGEELRNLKSDLESLRHNLQWAEALRDETRIESLRKAIKNGENRDPDLMYVKALKMVKQAKQMDCSEEEKEVLVEKWVNVAASARESLPQFNLEGLWVGK